MCLGICFSSLGGRGYPPFFVFMCFFSFCVGRGVIVREKAYFFRPVMHLESLECKGCAFIVALSLHMPMLYHRQSLFHVKLVGILLKDPCTA